MGTVLESYNNEKTYMIEIADEEGKTLDIATVEETEIEKILYVS
ncbi:MAG: DUF4926 domain-containing protein [Lachnospiraceae bacterium]